MAKTRRRHTSGDADDGLDVPGFLRRKGATRPAEQAETSAPPDLTPVSIKGMWYQRVFYTGVLITRPNSPVTYEVKEKDCPHFGQGAAFVVEPNEDGKRRKSSRLILFCPFTLKANQITPAAGELIQLVEIENRVRTIEHESHTQTKTDVIETPIPFPREELTVDRVAKLVKIITDKWATHCRLGLPGDFDVAATVLQRLGAPVPTERPTVRIDAETGEAVRHGKEAGDRLLRQVNPDTKRGRVYAYFSDPLGNKTIMEAMAEFGSTRSGILTHLHGLHGDHGIGYSLVGDVVEMLLPEGVTDPTTHEVVEEDDPLGGLGDEVSSADEEREAPEDRRVEPKLDKPKAARSAAAKRGGGKPLKDEVTKLPEKGKRRDVALLTAKGWIELEKAAEKVGCSEGSIRSHLVDLHNKHGFGYEQDGRKVRLLAPKGWKP